MLRREISERLEWLETQTHRLVALLAVLVIGTPLIARVAEAVRAPGPLSAEVTFHALLEGLEVIVKAADGVIAALLLIALGYRFFFLRKDNVEWSGALNDDELQQSLKGLFDRAAANTIVPVVQYSTDATIDELSDMNYEAFKDGRFAVEKEKLRKRNLAYQKKNPRIFMFIDNPLEPGKHIGYSAMVPLTHEGRESYLDGALKDADIPVSLIAENHEETGAVLLFAMHLLPAYSFIKSAAARDFSHYFLACVRHHAWSLFSPEGPGQSYPPLYIQTGVDSLRRRMIHKWHFVPTQRKSADGCEILALEQPFRTYEAG